MMTSFNLKNIDPGSPDLHFVEFIYGPTYLPNVVFLALAIAEIAWGHYLPLPHPPGPLIFRRSPGNVLNTVMAAGEVGRIIFVSFSSIFSL